jgi:hypothetical protein
VNAKLNVALFTEIDCTLEKKTQKIPLIIEQSGFKRVYDEP